MSVTQISQIQIRRGPEAELGTLASGELAWAIDTQRLFIGNGTLEEGAPIEGTTEILTINYLLGLGAGGGDGGTGGGTGGNITIGVTGSYTFRGIYSGYEAQTGIDADHPIHRTQQAKLDDIVNVTDFGAVGDGITDDTAAIQRAIDQVYDRLSPTTRVKARRALEFNPGVYKITAELRIPPYATLVGRGNNTLIVQSGLGTTCVAKLTTAVGTNTFDPNQSGYQYPESVYVTGITFQTNNDSHVFKLDSSQNIEFERVKFQGPFPAPSSAGSGSACVDINSVVKETGTISFKNCTFKYLNYGVNVTAGVRTKNILFNDCTFSNLYKGIRTYRTGIQAPTNIKVSDSVFNSIYSNAIDGDTDVTGIISLGNTYIEVGNHGNSDSSPAEPIIIFRADNNFSVADVFNRAETKAIPRIQANNVKIVSTAIDDVIRLANTYYTPGKPVTIGDGVTGETILRDIDHGIINYSVSRNTDTRSGAIKFSSKLSGSDQVTYEDEYVETTNIGIEFEVRKTSGQLYLRWTSDTTGYTSYLTFDVKTLH